MTTEMSRKAPIIDLVSSEIVQLKEVENPNFYNFDLEKVSLNPLAKQLSFAKDKRFDNNGIFGDLFDPKKKLRFGSEGESLLNIDKVESAKMLMLKPRITEQKPFDQYVTRDCSILEADCGTKLVSNIHTEDDLRE